MKTRAQTSVAAATLFTAAMIAASASPEAEAAGCALVANVPTRAAATIAHSVGGRSGCTNAVGSVAVAMYHQTWRWDDKMGSASRSNVTNATWTVVGNPKAGWDIYTRTNSSTGAQAQSGTMRW